MQQALVLICEGKVHGSLARAGKVKGQTPKVEKAEKKKKRTGSCQLLSFFFCSDRVFFPPSFSNIFGNHTLIMMAVFKYIGRCKRRLQYNKRFVNVAIGAGGKKKGPNSNADKVGI
jgi:small subunit ribosomal protein S30e